MLVLHPNHQHLPGNAEMSKTAKIPVASLVLLAAGVIFSGAAPGDSLATGTSLFPITVNGRCGYINREGKIKVSTQFEWCSEYFEGRAKFAEGRKYGFIDEMGNIAIKATFDEAEKFSEKRAAVKVGAKWGFIDRDGSMVVPPQFAKVSSFSEGLAVVRVDTLSGFIDQTGQMVIKPSFYWAEPFSNGFALVVGREPFDYSFIDRSGKNLFGRTFAFARSFSEGIAMVGLRRDLKNIGFEFIDVSGKVLSSMNPVRTRLHVRPVSEGLAIVSVEGHGYGYVDRTGNLAIQPRFESAEPFSEGLAAVELGGKWGYIDRTGRFVIPPRFRLEGAPFTNGLAMIQIETAAGIRRGYIDRTGKWIWRPTL